MLVLFCAVGIVDFHQWEHVDDIEEDTSCELCLLAHQQDSQLVLPAPPLSVPVVIVDESEPTTLANNPAVYERLCHLGYSNRPPPVQI